MPDREFEVTDEALRALSSKLDSLAAELPEDQRVALTTLLIMAGEQLEAPEPEVSGFSLPLSGVTITDVSAFQSSFARSFGPLTNNQFTPRVGSVSKNTICWEGA